MEYCEHGDLYNHLKKIRGRQLPETKILDWGIQITLALQALHAQRVLHRDLKTWRATPRNPCPWCVGERFAVGEIRRFAQTSGRWCEREPRDTRRLSRVTRL